MNKYVHTLVLLLTLFSPCVFSEENTWSAQSSLGFSYSEGNKDLSLFGTKFDLKYHENPFTWINSLAFNYGKESGEKNADDLLLKSQINFNIKPAFYTLINFEYFEDELAHLEHRVVLGPGLGFILKKTDSTKWASEIGCSYLNQKFFDEDETNDTVGRVTNELEYAFSKTSSFHYLIEYLPYFNDSNNYILKGKIGIKAHLTDMLALSFDVTDNYVNMPALGREKNDLNIMTSLVIQIL